MRRLAYYGITTDTLGLLHLNLVIKSKALGGSEHRDSKPALQNGKQQYSMSEINRVSIISVSP